MNMSKKRGLRIFKILFAIVVLIGSFAICHEAQLRKAQTEFVSKLENESGKYDPQKIIIYNLAENTAEKLAQKLNAEVRWTEQGDLAVLELADESDILQVASDRLLAKYTANMFPDYYLTLCDSDDGTIADDSYEIMQDLNILNTWDTTIGAGTTIAVIDSGVDTDSTRFTGRISEKSYNATQDKVVADYGWSVVEDESGHGTGIASIIAASADKESGISGVAPGAELLIIKCEPNDDGTYNSSDFLFAIAYAIECDVDVINMSFWGEGTLNPFEEYTKLAVDSDIICVAAAGNKATSVLGYPAADENVIGVGAVSDMSRGSYSVSAGLGWEDGYKIFELNNLSNYGDNSDVVALDSTLAWGLDGEIQEIRGTSVSSALVTGAVALYLSQNKYTEYADFRDMLFASTVDKGVDGEDWYYGYGMLDIHSLVVAEKGTITLDYLTDDILNQTQPFVVGHKIQSIDEPERDYVVFDGWYYDINCTDEFDYLVDTLHDDLTLYASWVNEDDTLPYTYQFVGDGTIEISGYRGKRRYITVPSQIDGFTVSAIGENAFMGNSRIREVTLPDTLKHIGDYAFADCPRLLSIEIPRTVESIGEHAFENDSRLAQVSIVSDAAMKSVGDYAFAFCGMLTRFDVPNGLEEIGGLAFYGASGIRQVTTTAQCVNYEIINGALCRISEDAYELVYYPASIRGEYSIPSEVNLIGEYAFAYSKLWNVELHDNLTELGDGCFTYSSLTSVSIPRGITSVPMQCFAYCDSLVSVELAEGVDTIEARSFYHCAELQEINFPDSLTMIGLEAFYCAENLSTVSYSQPELIKIDSGAFNGCWNLSDIGFIGHTICVIGNYAFSGCPINSVVLPATLKDLGECAFACCSYLTRVTFEDGIILEDNENTLSAALFRGCIQLESIAIPDSIETIGAYCFAETGLKSIAFSADIQQIKPGALSGCAQLTQITVDEGNSCYYAKDQVLYFRDPETEEITLHSYPAGLSDSFVVPDEVDRIGANAFENNQKLKSVVLNDNATVIEDYAFHFDSNLQTVIYKEGLREIKSNAFSHCYALTEQVFPESLETIGTYAFELCTNLQTVKMSKNLISIGYCAFNQTSSLTQIIFPEDAVISRLGNSAFAGSAITSFVIPASVTSMGQKVFERCEHLTEVSFAPNSRLTALPAWAFQEADNLTSITFGEGAALESIQARALEYLDKLSSINLEACRNLTTIDNYAFQFCKSLTSLKLPQNVEYIGRYAFYCCSSLSELTIPETMEYIGRYAFAYANQIRIYFTSAVLPQYLQENWDYGIGGYYLGTANVITDGDWSYAVLADGTVCVVAYTGDAKELDLSTVAGYTVSAIGSRAFADNGTLEQISLPDTLRAVFDQAFVNTGALKQIKIPASVTHIGAGIFDGSAISQVVFEDGISITSISNRCFANTKNLQTILIPYSVTEISPYAFYGSSLASVSFTADSQLTLIGRYAFADTALTHLALPGTLEKIDYYAFSGTSNLRELTFGTGTPLNLYGYAFYNSGLEQVYLPENIAYVGEFCFVNCKQLQSFAVADENTCYAARDGILFNKELTRLICCPAGKLGTYEIPADVSVLGFAAFEGSQLSSITIPEDSMLSTLGYRAFFNCDGITDVYIPATVLSIDYYAFAYCTQLENVAIAEGSQMCGIYEGAFYNCEKLNEITIPDTVKEICEYAFSGCVNLRTVNISEDSQLAGIFDNAFYDTGITEIHIPETVYELGNRVFAYTNLKSLTIPDSVKEIGFGILENNETITMLSLPFLGEVNEGEGKLGDAFNCENKFIPASLTTVTLTQMNTVPAGAFASCENLVDVNFTQPVLVVGEKAFCDCTALVSLDFLKDTQTIGAEAFRNCTAVTGTVAMDSVQVIGTRAFNGCSMTEVYIGNAREIGEYAFLQCDNLNRIEIYGENVLIGACAFMWNRNLQEIILHDGICDIAERAFWGISNATIEELRIPGSVKTIGERAFEGWYAIKSLYIEDGVAHIGKNAFTCANEGVGFVFIPGSVETIEEGAFNAECIFSARESAAVGWAEGWCVENTDLYYGCSDILNSEDGYTYLTCPDGAVILDYSGSETDMTVGTVDGTEVFAVASYAFAGENTIQKISFAECVKKLYGQAFYRASSLREVCMDYPMDQFGSEVFAECPELIRVTVRGDLGNAAFAQCPKLEHADVYDGAIGSSAFSQCDALAEVYLENITNIGGSAFSACDLITEITVPGTVKSIGDYAFDYCPKLKTVILEEGIQSIGECALGRTAMESIVIPDSVTSLGRLAFRDQYSLKVVSLGAGITSIPYGAFQHTGLQSVVLGDQVTVIGENAFYACSMLTEVILGSQTKEIGATAFMKCVSLEEIYIPETVTSIGASAFANDSKLFILFEGETLPETLGEDWDLGILGYSCGAQGTSKTDPDTQLQYNLVEGGAIVCGYSGTGGEVIIDTVAGGIPVIRILPEAFFENKTIQTVHIGPSVQEIGDSAFESCTNLTTITFDENSTLRRIGERAFRDCGLTSITIPGGVDTFGEYAFYSCKKLTSVIFEGNLESIPYYAFCYCSSLSNVKLPDSLRAIKGFAFAYCYGLESIRLPESLERIETAAFSECTNLQSVNTPDSCTYIGCAFSGCTRLGEWEDGLCYLNNWLISIDQSVESAKVREGTTIICGGAADLFADLTEVILPDSVKMIGPDAFSSCSKLTSVSFPASLECIEEAAFRNCPVLTDIVLHEGLQKIGKRAFCNCQAVTELVIPNSVTEIGEEAFANMTSLTYLSIPFVGGTYDDDNTLGYVLADEPYYSQTYQSLKTVEITGRVDRVYGFFLWDNPIEEIRFTGSSAESVVVAERAFYSASHLKVIELPDNIVSFDNEAFMYCEKLESIEWPGTLKRIGDLVFDGCVSLREIKLPDTLVSIGQYAFRGCSTLTDVMVPNSVESIGICAFEGCTALQKMSLPFAGTTEKTTGLWRLFDDYAAQASIPQSLTTVAITGDITELSYSGFDMGAFLYCPYIESVTLPNTLKSIGMNSFTGCSRLKNVNIPESVTNLGPRAFAYCDSLDCMIIPKNVVTIQDDALYSNMDTLVFLCDAETIPSRFGEIKNLVIRYNGKLPVVPTENLVLMEGSAGITETTLRGVSGIHIYCCETENAVPWPEGWNNENPVSFEGEWRYILFRVNGCVVKDDIQKNSEVILLPTKSLYNRTNVGDELCTFVGWDSTGDGKADNLLATNQTGVIYADAVYSVRDRSEVAYVTVSEEDVVQENEQLLVKAEVGDTDRVMVNIPDTILPDQAFTVKTTLGSIYFDDNAVKHLHSATDSGVVVSLEKVSVDLLAAASPETQIFALEITANGNQIAISNNGVGMAAVTVPCDIPGDVSAARVYRITDDGAMLQTDFTYDSAIKRITFYVSESGLYLIPGAHPVCTEHRYETTVINPTCENQGYSTYFCVICGEVYVGDYVDALGHSYGAWSVVKPVTCTADGEERRDCENCDYYETQIIASSGHNSESVVTAPTCTEKGYTTHTCSRCGYSYVDSYTNALGHKTGATVVENKVEATCETDGHYDNVVYCSVCNEELSRETVMIPATGHSLGAWKTTKEPTCTEAGEKQRSCSACGKTETETLSARGHSYEAVVTAPTCTEEGFTVYTCSACGDSYTSDYVTPKGHSYEAAVTAPTCTEKGYTTHTCTACGDSYVDTYVDALGHTMSAWHVVNPASCEKEGEEYRDCEACDYYESRTIAALGHSWDAGTVTVEPTEETEGEMRYTCISCGTTRTEVIPVLEHTHSYESNVTAPTCTEQGYTLFTCRCGHSYTDAFVEALGHDMSAWSVVKEAGCTEKGEEKSACSRCDHAQTREIPALGHTYESTVTEPTCSAQGYVTHTCTRCGDSYADSYTDALGHSFTHYVSDGNAGCTTDGTMTARCDRCDATDTKTESGSALGHSHEAQVTEPTCEAGGYTTYTCTRCGDSYVADYTEALGHSYENGECIRCHQEEYQVTWKSATTSLNGTIDLNIYVVLSENLLHAENTYVRFSYSNKVVDVPIAEGVESVSNGILRYRYSCPMYAKEVSEIVTVQVMKGDEVIGSALEYSIVTYCMNRINKSTNPAQVALCKALLNYAAAAQISLNYNTANLANAQLTEADKVLPDNIDVSGYAASNVGSETGIKTKSATLMLESEVSVRVYFTLEAGYDISDFTFTIDGKVVEPQKNNTGWFIETDGIAAKNLDQMMEFSVGGITVTYGPMSYVNSKLSNSKTNADTLNLVKALYAYWQAAEVLLG